MQYASFWLMLPQTPNLLATSVVQDGIIPKTVTHQLTSKLLTKHKQYLESNYVEEYDEKPEAYDVNLCIDDFQAPKCRRTQDYETGDYE